MSATRTNKSKRLPLAPVVKPAHIGCLECALCCSYVAVEISAPDTVNAATEILWYLYHEQVSVYRDSDDEWMVQFETRCKHLQDDNKCAIYEQRPPICRTYSAVTCEVNAGDEGTTFYTPEAFMTYLKTRSTRIHRAIQKRYLPASEHFSRTTAIAERPLAAFQSRYLALRARRVGGRAG